MGDINYQGNITDFSYWVGEEVVNVMVGLVPCVHMCPIKTHVTNLLYSVISRTGNSSDLSRSFVKPILTVNIARIANAVTITLYSKVTM